mgnify:FL=1
MNNVMLITVDTVGKEFQFEFINITTLMCTAIMETELVLQCKAMKLRMIVVVMYSSTGIEPFASACDSDAVLYL